MKRDLAPDRVERFIKSCDLMRHRGPDNKDIYREGRVLFVHFRLAIIDLSEEANQPFRSQSGRTVASYNGEIYNFRDLAPALNVELRTSSDTEILVETFEQHGPASIPTWNGVFAAAIYERPTRIVHLVRDRFGVKPLYYFETEDALLFASEAKVILDWLPSFQVDPQVLSQFMLYGHGTGTAGFIRGLKRTAPGEHIRINAATGAIKGSTRFWRVSDVQESKISMQDAVDRSRDLLEAAVRRQLVSDVPIALFLSGGIDSSTIAAFASRATAHPLDAYSIEYDVNIGGESEMERARMVADQFGLHHHEVRLGADDVGKIFADVVVQYDEPFADPASIALYQLSSACGQNRRVVLQGDGGDELFAGYRRYSVLKYHEINRLASSCYRFLPRGRFRQRLERIHEILTIPDRSRLVARYLTEETSSTDPKRMLSHSLQEAIAAYSGEEDYIDIGIRLAGRDAVQQLLYTDTSILLPWKYLEKVDKATMRSSIESRVPFLDNELANFVLSLPSSMKIRRGTRKHLLKEAMRGLIPESILFGRKRGFDVPIRAWMQRGLYDHAQDLFRSSDPRLIDRNAAVSTLSSYQAGELESVPLLWKTMVLSQWLYYYRHKIAF